MLAPVFRERVENGETNLHNPHGERPHSPEDGATSPESNNEGTWGERDLGGPVNFRAAMQEYEEMRRELSSISQTRSRQSRRSNRSNPQKSGLKKFLTGGSQRQEPDVEQPIDDREVESQVEEDMGEEKEEEDNEEVGEFQLTEFLKDGHFEKRVEGASAKKVGVLFKHLTGLSPFPLLVQKSPLTTQTQLREWVHRRQW